MASKSIQVVSSSKQSPLAGSNADVRTSYTKPKYDNAALIPDRSFIILVSGIGVFADGASVLYKYHEATNIQEIWAIGFGTTNAEELIYWHQPNGVRTPYFIPKLLSSHKRKGHSRTIRQRDNRQYLASPCLAWLHAQQCAAF
jgi:hypothetical protein